MSIKQTISTNVPQDSAGVAAVVNEATDGTKAVLTELATKNADDSGFTQVSENNPLPVKGELQLTGSNVPLDVSIGKEEGVATVVTNIQGTGTLVWETVYETQNPFVIDYLEWGTDNYSESRLGFSPRINYLASNLTSHYNTFSPERLEYGRFPYFDVVEFDKDSNVFVFRNKQPMYFPNGVKVERGTLATGDVRVSVVMRGRVV